MSSLDLPPRSESGQMDVKMTEEITNGMREASIEKSPRIGSILKGLTERKTTRDGQVPKRRGPKPDSRPALTRRQELNRQAQRTHRERKEVYVRTIEAELIKAKCANTDMETDYKHLYGENQQLKAILMHHGISFESFIQHPSPRLFNRSSSSSQTNGNSREQSVGHASSTYAASSLASNSATRVNTTGMSPAATSPAPGSTSSLPTMADVHKRQRTKSEISRSPRTVHHQSIIMDHDQVGVDFVLALEKVCHDHQQMMCVRAEQSDNLISGHALMMSMPPTEHVRKYPDSVFPHKAGFDVPANVLMKVHMSSMHLPIQGGELAPIQALGVVRNHERYGELNEGDFAFLTQKLAPSVRCYGFGAVLEEFELSDGLQELFQRKYEGFNLGL